VYTIRHALQEKKKKKGVFRNFQICICGHRIIFMTSPNLFPWLHVSGDGNMYATGFLPSWFDAVILSSIVYFDIYLGALG
jgi:hypothetical protein